MVSWELERPSEWSIGKMIAPIAILLLIIGPFLPYLIVQIRGVDLDITNERSYFDFDNSGFWMLIPLLSAILIIILLYFKFDIYFEKDGKRVKINSFILMLWGFLFFLMYLSDAVLIRSSIDYGGVSISYLPGIGLGMIIAGFLLCCIVGILEWRYPFTAGLKLPKVGPGKKEEPVVAAEVKAEQDAAGVPSIESEPEVKVEALKVEPIEEPGPIPVAPTVGAKKIEAVSREPTSEEEKELFRWAKHINEYGQTFEKCPKCEKYVFLRAKDTGDTIVFNCPDCGASFKLKK